MLKWGQDPSNNYIWFSFFNFCGRWGLQNFYSYMMGLLLVKFT